jgi:hypothetical protein
MRGKLWAAAALAAVLAGGAARAQDLPPLPGSTLEYQSGLEQSSQGRDAEGMDLLLRACDKKDAAGCSQLAQMSEARLATVKQKRPGATQLAFAQEAARLLRRRCTPTEDRDEGCAVYSAILSQFRFGNGYQLREVILEGGRLLAARCLAGKSTPEACGYVEPNLANGTPAERAALVAWVDKGFETGCASGDSALCERGFFRKYEPAMTQELMERLFRLVQASEKGCNGGSPVICVEAGIFLYERGNEQGRAIAADFIGAACRLPPKAGERDVQKGACDAEKEVRAALAKPKAG